MDGYIIGFIAISGMTLFVGLMAIIFLSLEGQSDTERDHRIQYRNIRHLTTNTIETVNLAGETEVWQRNTQ